MAMNTRESGRVAAGGGNVQQLTVGVVTDNVDPEEIGRIKVKFVALPGQPESTWIRHSTPNGGKLRGLYALPEVGDEVLVSFLQGNTANGQIVGDVWGGTEKPPTEAKDGLPGPAKTDTGASWSTETFTDGSKDLSANDRRLWRSRSGHLFVFDDTNGAETVQIWDKDHNLSFVFDSVKKLITIANKEGDLHIRTKQNLYLEAGQDIKIKSGQNINVETAQNTTWKDGMSYSHETGTEASIKAGTSMALEATTTFNAKGLNTTVEGTATVTMTGATAKMSGQAMSEITGGMVKIN